jgi:hypothetical protein
MALRKVHNTGRNLTEAKPLKFQPLKKTISAPPMPPFSISNEELAMSNGRF